MSWNETHSRWQALQEIELAANAGLLDELPWNADYEAVFGTPDALAAALRHRWRQARRAQLDTHLPEATLEEQRCRLHERHAAVLRLVQRYDDRQEAVSA